MWGAIAVGGVLGPALAGMLVATVGAGWAILGDGVSFASPRCCCSARPLRPRHGAGAARASGATSARAGTRSRSRTWLWTSIVYFAVFQLVYIPTISVLGPLISKQSLGGPAGLGADRHRAGDRRDPRQRARAAAAGRAAARSPRTSLILGTVPGLVLFALPASALVIAAAEIVAGAVVRPRRRRSGRRRCRRAFRADSLSRVAVLRLDGLDGAAAARARARRPGRGARRRPRRPCSPSRPSSSSARPRSSPSPTSAEQHDTDAEPESESEPEVLAARKPTPVSV